MKVKVFLSWSGPKSKKLAEIFAKHLRLIVQAAKPFHSENDIISGTVWSTTISRELEESKIGLLFLTRENLNSRWILFEAGALFRNLESKKVVPLLFGVAPGDIKGPLDQFNGAEFNEDKIKHVFRMINRELGDDSMDDLTFNKVFYKNWPDLKNEIEAEFDIVDSKKDKNIRSEKDLLEEILELSRNTVAAMGLGSSQVLAAAFRELSLHEQIFLFLDGIARQRTWTFYQPREGESEIGSALRQLVGGLIESEQEELKKRIINWLHSKNDNVIYFASEIVGYFPGKFKDLDTDLIDVYKDLDKNDKNREWTTSQLNCLWAHGRLTNFDELNTFLLTTLSEENQKWILFSYEQMVKALEIGQRVAATEFMPVLASLITQDLPDAVRVKAENLLEEFEGIVMTASQ
jgi:hypothetical protein